MSNKKGQNRRATPKGGRSKPESRSHAIPLAGGGSEPPVVELAPRELRVVARRILSSPITARLADIASVVDIRPAGADRTGLVGPRPLRRPPATGTLSSAGTRVSPSVALVFREPQQLVAGAARRLGVKVGKGEVAVLDVLELCPEDPDELIGALVGARVPEGASVGGALATVLGTIDDPDEAATVSAEREKVVRRTGLLSLLAILLPIVVLAVAAVFVPADARGQIVLMIGIWIGLGVVVGSSLRRSNARTIDRLGPPPDPGGGDLGEAPS